MKPSQSPVCDQEEKAQPSPTPAGCSTFAACITPRTEIMLDIEVMTTGEGREQLGDRHIPKKRERDNPETSANDCKVRSDHSFDVWASACVNVACQTLHACSSFASADHLLCI